MSISIQEQQILDNQSAKLDQIISEQRIIRYDVTSRNWDELEKSIKKLNTYSAEFSELEKKRLALNLSYEADISSDLFKEVRRKLIVSRVENDALSKYISITKNFLQEVFDNVIPQRRNTLYSPSGRLVKSIPNSLVLNTLS